MYYRLTYILQLLIAPLVLVGFSHLLLTYELLPASLQNFSELLVWVFALAGALLAVSYARIRNFFALFLILLTYLILVYQVIPTTLHTKTFALNIDFIAFHLSTSLLLPILITLNSLWAERFHLLQDLLLRFCALAGVALLTFTLAKNFPNQINHLITFTHFPSIYLPFLEMSQAFQLVLIACTGILLLQLFLNPQPYFAAQLVALVSSTFMLQEFLKPNSPTLITLATLLMLSLAILHEAFHMAFRDDLTGLPGRRALNERLQRLGNHYSIGMADIDHFKNFNDTYGHDVGDQVLRMVAKQLNKVGGSGKAYRYGGEEFAIIFPSTHATQAKHHLEKLRLAIEHYPIKIRDTNNRPKNNRVGKTQRKNNDAKKVSLTISMGVAERNSNLTTPEEVIKAADQALYQAKGAGRNQIALYN